MPVNASAPALLISPPDAVLMKLMAVEKLLGITPVAHLDTVVCAFVGLAFDVSCGQGPSSVRKEIAPASGKLHSGPNGEVLRAGLCVAEQRTTLLRFGFAARF